MILFRVKAPSSPWEKVCAKVKKITICRTSLLKQMVTRLNGSRGARTGVKKMAAASGTQSPREVRQHYADCTQRIMLTMWRLALVVPRLFKLKVKVAHGERQEAMISKTSGRLLTSFQCPPAIQRNVSGKSSD